MTCAFYFIVYDIVFHMEWKINYFYLFIYLSSLLTCITNLQICSPALICGLCCRAYMSSDMAGFWAARGRPKRELTAQECLDLEPTLAALEDANRDLVGGVLCQEGDAENHHNLPVK
jgi:hypothetical protein